ncbi:helix-turn-helix domain-containing protein [Rouxiella badensis]|uniref:helix-turn-helix domain-containing protein n=1 Tax=Rouxiella badensis TaxID=1646377 RepID=UPI0028D41280|nr:helix-turn-helix domain-containing protein [Rouxiella badensis]
MNTDQSLRNRVLNEMLVWIEGNLDKPLSLDLLANRSGYTKWYLHRIFKEYTGLSLGEYCKLRRLSRSAVLLMLTQTRIVDIANELCFTSTQTFSRAFKSQFSKTPNAFRLSDTWDIRGFCGPHHNMRELMSTPQILDLKSINVVGIGYELSCKFEEETKFDFSIRESLLERKTAKSTNNIIIGLVDYVSSGDKINYRIKYTAASLISENRANTKSESLLMLAAENMRSSSMLGRVKA